MDSSSSIQQSEETKEQREAVIRRRYDKFVTKEGDGIIIRRGKPPKQPTTQQREPRRP
jgi:uncharacterized protein YchJ